MTVGVKQLTRITIQCSLSVMSQVLLAHRIPALQMKSSIFQFFSIRYLIISSTYYLLLKSTLLHSQLPPYQEIYLLTSSKRSLRRSMMRIRQWQSLASSKAISLPIPIHAPAIRTRLFLSNLTGCVLLKTRLRICASVIASTPQATMHENPSKILEKLIIMIQLYHWLADLLSFASYLARFSICLFFFAVLELSYSSSIYSLLIFKKIIPSFINDTSLTETWSRVAFLMSCKIYLSIRNYLAYLVQTGHFHVLALLTYIKRRQVLRSKHCPCRHFTPLTGVCINMPVQGSLRVQITFYNSTSQSPISIRLVMKSPPYIFTDFQYLLQS